MHQPIYEADQTKPKVKLYRYENGDVWVDLGTGILSFMQIQESECYRNNYEVSLMMSIISEKDGTEFFSSSISAKSNYQKEEKTMIMWVETSGSVDTTYALAFLTAEIRDDVWDRIQQSKAKYEALLQERDLSDGNDLHNSSAGMDMGALDTNMIELPPCKLGKLDNLENFLHQFIPEKAHHDNLALALENQGYIPKLIELFRQCEDLEDFDDLHNLFNIFKMLFMLEKNSLFETMFSPENILDIVGVLEYDPSKSTKTPHRVYIKQCVKFKEVIPIANEELLAKIHQTFHVQYIKDILVPVPLIFDDTGSTLHSFIIFNKIQILEIIQDDKKFLEDIFEKLTNDEVSDEKRKEIILLLKEFCLYSQLLQPNKREDFIKMLANIGLLQSIEQLLNIDDKEIQHVLIDIICTICDCMPSLIRIYMCHVSVEEESMLLNVLINHLVTDEKGDLTAVLLQTLRTLLDPGNMGLQNNQQGINRTERSEFLSFFYRYNMHVLTEPVLAVTATDELTGKDDSKRAEVLDNIVNILTFCVEHHTTSIKNYIVSKDMLRRVLVLLQSKHRFLALSALRFCRRIVNQKDDIYNKYIVVGRLFKPIIQAFLINGKRYNLLNSAILELFQFIRSENIKILVAYIVENHIEALRDITYVDTFVFLERLYEQEKDRQENPPQDSSSSSSNTEYPAYGIIHNAKSLREKRDDRTMDQYEESWFDSEEDQTPDNNPIHTDNPVADQIAPTLAEVAEDPVTRPLSAQTVELFDNLLLRKTSTDNSINIGPVSPSFDGEKRGRPNSPVSSELWKTDSVFSNNKPIVGTTRTLLQNKLAGNKVQFKINSSHASLSESSAHTNGDLLTLNNGRESDEHRTNHVAEQQVVTNSLLTSLVDYPDDDDDTDEEEGAETSAGRINNSSSKDNGEIPLSPAKKQRISSS